MTNKQPYLLQTGMGVDLHGSNSTTAAIRAVRNAISYNKLLFLKHLNVDTANGLIVDVTIACPYPAEMDHEAILRELPAGKVDIQAQVGGMHIDSDASGDLVRIAIAAVQVTVQG